MTVGFWGNLALLPCCGFSREFRELWLPLTPARPVSLGCRCCRLQPRYLHSWAGLRPSVLSTPLQAPQDVPAVPSCLTTVPSGSPSSCTRILVKGRHDWICIFILVPKNVKECPQQVCVTEQLCLHFRSQHPSLLVFPLCFSEGGGGALNMF